MKIILLLGMVAILSACGTSNETRTDSGDQIRSLTDCSYVAEAQYDHGSWVRINNSSYKDYNSCWNDLNKWEERQRDSGVNNVTDTRCRDTCGSDGSRSANCATIYEDSRYRGDQLLIEDEADIANLSEYGRWFGDWNDIVSSVKVYNGCKLTMWEHSKQRGAEKVFTSNNRALPSGFNDKASSLICNCN